MKLLSLGLFLVCGVAHALGAYSHRASPSWKQVNVRQLGISFSAPSNIYDQDFNQISREETYALYSFNLYTIRFGGLLSERRPIIWAKFLRFSADEYAKMRSEEGYSLNIFMEKPAAFHAEVTTYPGVGAGALKATVYRRDFKQADGSVLCVQISRLDYPDIDQFVAEDDLLIRKILGSISAETK
jgi:hypothetical protein